MSTHSRLVPETIAIPDRRALVAAGIGNCLELFDLTVFGFFAVVIGNQFFPSADPLTSILGSFATFAIGFLMRPAGALILASIGDRHGNAHVGVVGVGGENFTTVDDPAGAILDGFGARSRCVGARFGLGQRLRPAVAAPRRCRGW